MSGAQCVRCVVQMLDACALSLYSNVCTLNHPQYQFRRGASREFNSRSGFQETRIGVSDDFSDFQPAHTWAAITHALQIDCGKAAAKWRLEANWANM